MSTRSRSKPTGKKAETAEAKRTYKTIDDQHRSYEAEHGVVIFEQRVRKLFKDGTEQFVWQPIGRDTPVLLITTPAAFKPEHEVMMRRESHLEPRNKVIRGALKKHQVDGELYFEMGRTDAEMDDVIAYAIDLLQGVGVKAERAIRWSPHTSRATW